MLKSGPIIQPYKTNIKHTDYYNKKIEKIIKSQKFCREHKNKKKLYIGIEEPKCIVRIYENEYDINNDIKSIEIKIYSIFFKKYVSVIKSINELFGEESLTREKIIKKIDLIYRQIMGFKKNTNNNNDYYDKSKADISSEDFDDFEKD